MSKVLAESLLGNLPDPSNKFYKESVFLYYSNSPIHEAFNIRNTLTEKVFKLWKMLRLLKLPAWENSQEGF